MRGWKERIILHSQKFTHQAIHI